MTVRGGEPTTAWFDIATFQDLYEAEDADGLRESQREVHRLIREERQVLRNAGRAPRVAVAGFSQVRLGAELDRPLWEPLLITHLFSLVFFVHRVRSCHSSRP